MFVRQVADPKLAQFAYLIGCPRTGEAIVIDPERDVDRYFDLAASHKLRLVAAADTHIHADYLSGIVGYFTPETLDRFAPTTGSLRRFRTIEMPELEKQRMGSDARVLDVRSDAEFEDGHVPGALHIPYARIAVSATKLPVNTPLIVYL